MRRCLAMPLNGYPPRIMFPLLSFSLRSSTNMEYQPRLYYNFYFSLHWRQSVTGGHQVWVTSYFASCFILSAMVLMEACRDAYKSSPTFPAHIDFISLPHLLCVILPVFYRKKRIAAEKT